MKGLLHSKRFRKNLYKWLFMYAGVMLLLTTVVTYSKYMTSQTMGDSARVTKFNVKINFNEESGCINDNYENTCETKNYRPTEEIVYNFTVDTSELEVTTDLAVTVKVKDDFDFISLKDENGQVGYTNTNNNGTMTFWLDKVEVSDTTRTKNYQVIVKLKDEKINEYINNKTVNNEDTMYTNVIYIGYSAVQSTN